VPVELAEAPAEGDVLLARDPLLTEQQDAPFEEGAVDLVELRIADRPGQVDALDLGAERVGQGRTVMDIAGRPRGFELSHTVRSERVGQHGRLQCCLPFRATKARAYAPALQSG
jgi:hypothetical protein